MLASRSASVALLDRADATSLAEQLAAEHHVNSQFFHVDVSDAQSVAATFATVLAWSGKLDVCVNSAGIFPPGNSIDTTPIEQWSRILSVNLNGTFYCLQQEIQAFERQGTSGGAIVNLSSDAGSVAMAGCQARHQWPHENSGIEYAKEGIWINAISPGNIDKPMVQQFGIPPHRAMNLPLCTLRILLAHVCSHGSRNNINIPSLMSRTGVSGIDSISISVLQICQNHYPG